MNKVTGHGHQPYHRPADHRPPRPKGGICNPPSLEQILTPKAPKPHYPCHVPPVNVTGVALQIFKGVFQ